MTMDLPPRRREKSVLSAPEFLTRVFALTLDSPIEEMRMLCYAEAHLGLGVMLWWPPLSEVWLDGPHPPRHWRSGHRARAWRDAHTLLMALHAEFKAARGGDA